MPIIKYKELNDDMLGKYNAKQIVGVRIDNGEEWSKKFFADNKKLLAELDEFGKGEIVNVRLQQKGKNWNVVSFEKPNPDVVAALEAKNSNARGGNSGAGKKWDGRKGDAYDRSASIYLAFEW